MFYVWLNGVFVGYSEVSHATSMFDVSPYLKEGRNRLMVLNLKWSTGTYYEVQHKWRQTEIFRDVYLLKPILNIDLKAVGNGGTMIVKHFCSTV